MRNLGLLCLASFAVSALVGYSAELPPLIVPRSRPIALLRDDGKLYVFGGESAEALGTLELYDPVRGCTLLAARPLLEPFGTQEEDAVVLPGNRILVCKLRTCQVYQPDKDVWESRQIDGSLTPLVPLDNGQILRAGGRGDLLDNNSTYLIDPWSLSATRAAYMTGAHSSGAIIKLADGRVLAAGGLIHFLVGLMPLSSAEIYDPRADSWTAISPMKHLTGLVWGLALKDGRAFLAGGLTLGAEIYNPAKDEWSIVAGVDWSYGSLALLPGGTVLIAGGKDTAGNAIGRTTIYNPRSGAVRPGAPMRIPRMYYELVVLPNGKVLAIGGRTAGGVATASVEEISLGPTVAASLDAGFYVATSKPAGPLDSGFAGIEVTASGAMDGGLNFGGTLPGGGRDVGFGGFYLPEAQTVRGSVDFQPIGSGTFEVTVRLLDVNKQPEGAPILGGTHVEFTRALAAGFHVIELQSGDRSPPATYQFALSAQHLAGGAVAGGVLDPALGAPGFAAFYLPERQDVTIRLYNENTYGSPRGAGEVILTLYDSTGKVIARSGPGAAAP